MTKAPIQPHKTKPGLWSPKSKREALNTKKNERNAAAHGKISPMDTRGVYRASKSYAKKSVNQSYERITKNMSRSHILLGLFSCCHWRGASVRCRDPDWLRRARTQPDRLSSSTTSGLFVKPAPVNTLHKHPTGRAFVKAGTFPSAAKITKEGKKIEEKSE